MVLIRRSVIIRKVCFWDCRCGYAALLSVSCDRRDARVCGAEIDFVIQRDGQLIPIEVKSADNTRAKSLKVYMETVTFTITVGVIIIVKKPYFNTFPICS